MNIVDFTYSHRAEATALALAGYEEECRSVSALPQVDTVPDLGTFADNGLGVAALEGGKMLGFICCYPPFDNAFRSTDVRGLFSPMGANAAIKENRGKIYTAMYQAAGEKWVSAGAVCHALCLYAHDEELQRQFYLYGFGLRCIDAIRPLSLEAIDCMPCEGYTFVELAKNEYSLLYPLDFLLNRHYCHSPFFMNRKPDSAEDFEEQCASENARYFAAKQNDQLCAFIKIAETGEAFIAGGPAYRHIRGAYCLPEHRGKGVYQNLLNLTLSTLKAEGYAYLGVDFESLNPTAYGFWLKYFSPYTHSVVRRIDERILEVKNEQ